MSTMTHEDWKQTQLDSTRIIAEDALKSANRALALMTVALLVQLFHCFYHAR